MCPVAYEIEHYDKSQRIFDTEGGMDIEMRVRHGLALLVLIGVLLYGSVLQAAASAEEGTDVGVVPLAAEAGLRFITSANEPIANDVVWVFCYTNDQATTIQKALL